MNDIPHTIQQVDSQHAVWIAGPGCVRYDILGEEHNQAQMQRVAASVHGRPDVPIAAWLTPEPGGVVVWCQGQKVGYLPGALAAAWHRALIGLGECHRLQVACQATLDLPNHHNHGVLGLAVWLPPLPGAVHAPPVSQGARVSQAGPAIAAAPAPLPAAELGRIQAELATTRSQLEQAKKELGAVEEALEIQSFGFYTPRYGFESSAQYVARLKGIRDEQQRLIKADQAAPCDTKWTVGGSAAEGKKMVKQQAKLMLRAFNGECDAAIAKVRYDNVVTMEKRIEKAYGDINKLGEVQRVFISRRYVDLRLAELHLVFEHREKLEEEKQEQRRIKEQMREEQKARAEIEKAKAEAEKEEATTVAALEKARAELAADHEATSKQHEKLEALVSRLENELSEALDRKAKAIARAQLTKSGHVYVLSNVGSFGEGVYKIGLTRRLDPYERVDELGDASVPFPFDVHAVIFAEDAPGLENKLHRAFAERRVNLVNMRKEYFRVTLDEIREELTKHHGLVSMTLTAEAEEYRKSLSAREAGVVPELIEPELLTGT